MDAKFCKQFFIQNHQIKKLLINSLNEKTGKYLFQSFKAIRTAYEKIIIKNEKSI